MSEQTVPEEKARGQVKVGCEGVKRKGEKESEDGERRGNRGGGTEQDGGWRWYSIAWHGGSVPVRARVEGYDDGKVDERMGQHMRQDGRMDKNAGQHVRRTRRSPEKTAMCKEGRREEKMTRWKRKNTTV